MRSLLALHKERNNFKTMQLFKSKTQGKTMASILFSEENVYNLNLQK